MLILVNGGRLMRLGGMLACLAILPCGMSQAASPVEADWYDGRWPHERTDLPPHPDAVFGRLDNGFRYVILRNPKPAGRVQLSLDVQVGSLMESDGQRGTAHYLEHMAFNGSRHFPPGALIPFLQEHGMRFGGDVNAHTSQTETVYDLNLAPKTTADLEKGLLVLRDIAGDLTLGAEEVEKERGVVLSEKTARDSEKSRLARQRRELLFSGTQFVNDTIGTDADLAAADASSLRRFYDVWYRPDRMVLVVVGDADPTILRPLIETRFADMRPRAEPVAVGWWGDVRHQGVVVQHERTAKAGFSVSVTALHPRDRRPDSLTEQRRQLAGMIAREIFQRRLQAQSGGTSLFISASNTTSSLYNLFPSASLSAACRSDKALECLSGLGRELGAALASGFSDQEFADALRFQRTRIDSLLADAVRRQSKDIASEIVSSLNTDQVFQSEDQARAALMPMLDQIDKAEAETVFRAAWNSGNRVITSSGDVDLGRDPAAALTRAWEEGESTAEPYQITAAASRFPYLPEPSRPLDTVGTSSRTLPGSQLTERRIELSNGLTLRLLPTPFNTGKLSLTLLFGTGLDALSDGEHRIALTAAGVLRGSGPGKLDREDYRRTFAARQIKVGERYGRDAFSITAEGTTQDQDLLLTALWTQFRDPQPREDERLRLLESLKIGRSDRLNTLDGVIPTTVENILFGGAKRSIDLDEDFAASVTLADIKAFLARSRQEGPRTLIAVGDFDPDALATRAALLFAAAAPPTAPAPAAAPQAPIFPAGQAHRKTIDAVFDQAVLMLAWRADTTDESDQPALATRRLFAAVLNDRLRDKIREEMGVSYSPSARYRYDSDFSGYGFYMVTVATDHANLDRVRVAAIEVARTLARETLPPGTADRMRAAALANGETARQQDRYWQRLIEQESLRGKPVAEWSAQQTGALREVTEADLEAAAAALAIAPAEIVVEGKQEKVTVR